MSDVRQGRDNRIHPTAMIVGDVALGDRNYVGPGALLIGPLRIGDGNVFGPKVVIGTPAEDDIIHPDQFLEMMEGRSAGFGSTVIGHGNIFREFVTVHRGLVGETRIGSNTFMMAHSHCAHDCIILDGVKFGPNVQLAGFTTVGEGAYLGLSAVVLQFSVIGAHSMIGMNATVARSVAPFSTVMGTPAKAVRPNHLALRKLGIDDSAWWNPAWEPDSGVEGFPEGVIRFFSSYGETLTRAQQKAEEIRDWRSRKIKLADRR